MTGTNETTAAAIETEGLTLRYAGAKRAAVDHLDLRVEAGEFFGLVGPNGAGKSTTIALLRGLLSPTAGHARIVGIDPARDPMAVKREIGVLTEETALPEHLTALEFLEWSGTLRGLTPHESRRRTEDLVQLLDLSGAGERPIAGYSMGMKKKTALAGALLHRPRVLFLDEPLNGVDAVSARAIRDLLTRLTTRHGTTILFTSHVLETVERLCDRVAILRAGRLLAVGTSDELRAHTGIGPAAPFEEVFLRLIASGVSAAVPSG